MDNKSISNSEAGKGDRARNCFSQKYRDNFDSINWDKKQKKENEKIINNPDNLTDK